MDLTRLRHFLLTLPGATEDTPFGPEIPVDQDLRAKRGIFGGARQGQQKVAQTGQIHGGFSRKG